MPNKFDRINRQKLRDQLIADHLKRKEEETQENQQRKENENGKPELKQSYSWWQIDRRS